MKRSAHNLGFYRLLTGGQGQLIPIGCVEVLPGDTFKHSTSALVRLSPLSAPVMHPVHARIHHWFVPTRLIWDDFEKFITGGPDGLDASVFPTKSWSGGGLVNAAKGSLQNHLGCPPLTSGTHVVSALPLRAYSEIWNEWYRDQDLETELTVSKASGADTTTNVLLQKVAWEKDYFTVARPWAAKGAAVTIPVERATAAPSWKAYSGVTPWAVAGAGDVVTAADGTVGNGTVPLAFDPMGGLVLNPDDLRLGMALMRYKEARAQYGSRYTEYLRYLGIRSSDARLQRPEYLGGGQQTIQFSEILQTTPDSASGTSAATGVGDLYGHGIGGVKSNKYLRFFEEHGFVISLLSIKPKTIYANALPRMFNRRTKEDFFQKELQFIGQQAILNKEVKVDHATPDGTFGYGDRYDDYRQTLSQVSGEFSPGGSLTNWHMARIFSSDPALNSTFTQANPTNRVYTDSSLAAGSEFQVMANHRLFARRIISQNGGSSRVF